MTKILVLGASGMAGHMIHLYLYENGFNTHGIARGFPKQLPNTSRMDVLDTDRLGKFVQKENFDVIINCVGILNSAADANRAHAVFINSYLPHWLSNLNAKLIHISTDCVFSGNSGAYPDSATPDGPSFYDRSKALGEVLNNKDLTLRQSIVGPELACVGIGLLNWFLLQGGSVRGYKNAIWNGITTLELAKGIVFSIQNKSSGLHQMVHPKPVSKFELLEEFHRAFPKKSRFIEAYNNQPSLDKSLKSTRLDFGFQVKSYSEQLKELSSWMMRHQDLYEHYELEGAIR